MLKFSTFRTLNESSSLINDTKHLKHLSHPEENVYVPGGFEHSLSALWKVHRHLLVGEAAKDLLISTKIDGSPAIVFGVHPLTKRFFVGTKAVFNKTPKINYSVADIKANHGHSMGLVSKLEGALKYLPKIMPSRGGVFQCDFLFDAWDKTEDRFGIHFKPNTINYTVNKDHKDYRSIKRAKYGIAVHTIYSGTAKSEDSLEGLYSNFDSRGIKLQNNADVHQSDINFNSSTISTYEHGKTIDLLLKEAESKYRRFSRTDLEVLYFHSVLLRTFINFNIRNSGKTTIAEYKRYAVEKLKAKVAGMKSEAGKVKHQAVLDEWIENYERNKNVLKTSLEIHNIIQDAKDLIVDAMNTATQQYDHTVDGVKTSPEGYVATVSGMPLKLVHRHEFSRLNFNNSKF